MSHEMNRYENKLVGWLIPIQDQERRLRAFSHTATTPATVPEWIPLDLPEMGDTVMFDARTLQLLHNHDVSFIVTTNKDVQKIHAVEVRKKDAIKPTEGVVQ